MAPLTRSHNRRASASTSSAAPLPKRPAEPEPDTVNIDSEHQSKKLRRSEPDTAAKAMTPETTTEATTLGTTSIHIVRNPFLLALSGETRNQIYGELLKGNCQLEVDFANNDSESFLLASELDVGPYNGSLPLPPIPLLDDSATAADRAFWNSLASRPDPQVWHEPLEEGGTTISYFRPEDDDLRDEGETFMMLFDFSNGSEGAECVDNLKDIMQVGVPQISHEARTFFYANNEFWVHVDEENVEHAYLQWIRFLEAAGLEARMVMKRLILHGHYADIPLTENGCILDWNTRMTLSGQRLIHSLQLLEECERLEQLRLVLSFTDMFAAEQPALKDFLLRGKELSVPGMYDLLRLKNLEHLRYLQINFRSEMNRKDSTKYSHNMFEVLPPPHEGRDLRFMKFALSGDRPKKILEAVRQFLRDRFPPTCKVVIRWMGHLEDTRKDDGELDYELWEMGHDEVPGSAEEGTEEDEDFSSFEESDYSEDEDLDPTEEFKCPKDVDLGPEESHYSEAEESDSEESSDSHTPPPPIIEEGIEKWIVDKILRRIKTKGGDKYEVKWKGYDETSQEPVKQLREDVPDIVAKFEAGRVRGGVVRRVVPLVIAHWPQFRGDGT
ncbi:hypothetical protein BU16DRAFT_538501 [Lophium mytilinum]|uniref:Chromo domain-containing protein n=1 Tax=Lophium mytilinum TaxID=390894 RepID=A0A6A6QVF5_9PEZI|nr:hypothetical protein BU16DRAFT_538501 [Lophium mytilinum]